MQKVSDENTKRERWAVSGYITHLSPIVNVISVRKRLTTPQSYGPHARTTQIARQDQQT